MFTRNGKTKRKDGLKPASKPPFTLHRFWKTRSSSQAVQGSSLALCSLGKGAPQKTQSFRQYCEKPKLPEKAGELSPRPGLAS